MKRRTFIVISALGAIAAGIPLGKSLFSPSVNKEAIARPQFLSFLSDMNTAREIGIAYREQVPDESGQHTLVDLLLEGVPEDVLSHASDSSSVQKFLDKKIRQDFEAGRTVVIQGWVLAVTEARQCALLSLLQS